MGLVSEDLSLKHQCYFIKSWQFVLRHIESFLGTLLGFFHLGFLRADKRLVAAGLIWLPGVSACPKHNYTCTVMKTKLCGLHSSIKSTATDSKLEPPAQKSAQTKGDFAEKASE